MGIWEALKRAYVQVTGKSDGMYRIHSNRVGLPSDGDVFFDMAASSPQQTPPGVVWYKDANGDWAWKYEKDTSGFAHVVTDFRTAPESGNQSANVYLDRQTHMGPYGSDGVSTISSNSTVNPMLAKSVSITAQADGSVTAADLIAAGAAGVKHIVYYLSLGAGDLAVAGQGKQLTLSDGIGYISATGCVKGPIKQATAATAIQYSAAAGMFGNAEVVTLNVVYRLGT